MKLYSYTLFIDILGYSNAIKNISSVDEAKEIFNLLDIIEISIKEYFEGATKSSAYKEYSLHYTFFSDSIILSFVPKKDLLIDKDEIIFFNQTTLEFIFTWIMNIQFITLLKTGLLLRGAISCKDIYWDINNKVVGPALIEAYNLESKKASWPRIILSEELSSDISLIKHINFTSQNDNYVYLAHTLLLKENGEELYYYNYLGRMLGKLNINNLLPETMDSEFIPHLDKSFPNWKEKVTKEDYYKVAEIVDNFIIGHLHIIVENLVNEDKYIKEKYINLKNYHNQALTDFVDFNEEFLSLIDLIIYH